MKSGATAFLVFFITLALLPLANADSIEFVNQNPKWACSCEPVAFQIRLQNDAPALKHYTVSVDSLEQPLFSSATLDSVVVPAKSSQTFELRASIACDAAPGDHAFVLSTEDVYGNSVETNGFVFVKRCSYVDVQVTASRESDVACIGDDNVYRIIMRNAGTEVEHVRVSAYAVLNSTLSQEEFTIAPGEYAESLLHFFVPDDYETGEMPYRVVVESNSRTQEVQGVATIARCAGLQLLVPSLIEARAGETTKANFIVANAGDSADVAVLSLDCPNFTELSIGAVALTPGDWTNETALLITPNEEHAGYSYNCSVIATSQRYGLRYDAPTTINVLFSGTPRPPKPPQLNDSEEFEQPASVAEVIIDASGSMNATVSGVRKIDTAKQFVAAFVDRISSMKTGFRVYGSQYNENDSRACTDTKVLYPINYVDGRAVKQEINQVEPRGLTPLAYSLSRAAQDFEDNNESKLVVIISDGLESCGGDPCAVASELNLKHARVFAIGFDIDARGREQLQCLARATDGRYYDAKNYRDLINVVDLIFVKKKLIDLLEVTYVNQSIVEEKDGFRVARLDFTVYNRGDLTRAYPRIEGLPNTTQTTFDPTAFYVATSATQNFSTLVRVPQDRDYYEAMLYVQSTRGNFSLPIAVRAREPFASNLTGLFVAAAPIVGALVLLAILAAIVYVWYKNQKRMVKPQQGAQAPTPPSKSLGQRWQEFWSRFRRPRYGYYRPYR